jgi:hypothetical protein
MDAEAADNKEQPNPTKAEREELMRDRHRSTARGLGQKPMVDYHRQCGDTP